MKIKLPDNYKIYNAGSPGSNENSFYIHDELNNKFSELLIKFSDINKIIEIYEKLLLDAAKAKIPEEYKIEVQFGLTRKHYHLYKDGDFQSSFNDIFELEKVANKRTDFDLQLEKLNNREEIEINE